MFINTDQSLSIFTGFQVEEVDPQRNFRTSKRGTLVNWAPLWMKESSWEIRREQRGGKGTNKILVGTKTSQLFHSAASKDGSGRQQRWEKGPCTNDVRTGREMGANRGFLIRKKRRGDKFPGLLADVSCTWPQTAKWSVKRTRMFSDRAALKQE